MKQLIRKSREAIITMVVLPLVLLSGAAWAAISGVTGTTFNLVARAGYISTGDGQSLLAWGYANGPGVMQYPGPTLIVNQGDTVTINLSNELGVPVSMVFPGQSGVTTSGGVPGSITQEAAPAGAVGYTFTAVNAGTYLYHSGTQPELQVEMGLVGTLIVRPPVANQAYGHADTAYDHEYLFFFTEMDKRVHEAVAAGNMAAIDNTDYKPTLWFLNGRNLPDTLFPDFAPWLPNQPYGSLVRMHPGEKVLMRIVGAGRDLHPFHPHGNNFIVIARDGRMLESTPGAGPDLSYSDYTIEVIPGETYDTLFTWTGKGLGFDIYGHAPGDPLEPNEYAGDHGKAFPVVLPEQQSLVFGGFWSGSPYMGVFGNLPPGEGGLNPNAGYTFPWHSHTEKELANDDIFPGGIFTMLIVEPPGVPIP